MKSVVNTFSNNRNKLQRKPKGQLRMDNQETLATLGTHTRKINK